jgi:hypothetical protein
MEKILYVCNDTDFLNGSFDFAAFMARLTKSVLTGVFIENLDWEEVPVAKSLGGHPYIDYTVSTALPENEQKRVRTTMEVQKFRDACAVRDVKCKVHIDRNTPVKELLLESRYADLIILDPAITYIERDKSVPTKFVKEILRKAECPVIIAPDYFNTIDKLLFAYDGSKSAVFSMKQFTYLFPEFRDCKTMLIEVLSSDESAATEKYKLREWLGMHYSDVEIVELKGDEEDELFRCLYPKKDGIVVMDGFNRSSLSRLIEPSVSEPLLRLLPLPVFISHSC